MLRVNHPVKEKFQVPPEVPETEYFRARIRLEIKKKLQARIKYLCNIIGMAPDAARRQAEAEAAQTDSET